MKHLCDSNVFIALALEAHLHHRTAARWLETLSPGDALFFCRSTQTAFLRLLTVAEWMKENVCTNNQAIKTYETLRSDSRIFFADEPTDIERQWLLFARQQNPSPKRWMDAYLAAFASLSNMSFVTFDRGFSSYQGLSLLVLKD